MTEDDTALDRLVVIGARGFLGSALVRAARARGHSVAAFARGEAISNDVADPAFDDAGVVFYCAGSVNPRSAEEYPDRVRGELSDFEGFMSVVATMRHPVHLVVPSSGGTVYDPDLEPPYDEWSPVAPRSAYGRLKAQIEELARRNGPATVTLLRIANVYGPGQPVGTGQGVIANWLDAIRRGNEIEMFGEGEVTRDFVHVDDVVDALLCAGEARAHGIFNVGSGVPTTLAELASIVQRVVAPMPARIRLLPSRRFDVPRTYLNVDRARDELNWKPRVSLEEGLERTWRAFSNT